MPFQKGQSGNPEGRRKEQPFATMLRIAIKEAGATKGTTKLRDVADMLVSEAASGNIQAIRELADRLDGKPSQAVQIGGDADNPVLHAVTINHVGTDGND